MVFFNTGAARCFFSAVHEPQIFLQKEEVCFGAMPPYVAIIVAVAALAVGFFVGYNQRKRVAEREISSAEEEAKRIVNDAIKSAEAKKRESLLEAKEEIHRRRSEADRDLKERRSELQKQENRLQQKEENLDRKTDAIEKKEEDPLPKDCRDGCPAGGDPDH